MKEAHRKTVEAIKESVNNLLKGYLFEANDEITRHRISSTAKHLLDDYKRERLLYDYNVVCDETNNSPEQIDRGRLVTDVYLQPYRTVEYITLRAVIQPQGAEFEYTPEIVFESETDAYLDRIGA